MVERFEMIALQFIYQFGLLSFSQFLFGAQSSSYVGDDSTLYICILYPPYFSSLLVLCSVGRIGSLWRMLCLL